MNSKMLLAPILAFVLALLIAGAVSMWPHDPYLFNPEPTPTPQSNWPTAAPTPAASAADLYSLPMFFFIVFLAVIVSIAVVLLYFRKEPK